jgi:hypothetical protein
MAVIDDLKALGDFLSCAKQRIGKTFEEIDTELGVTSSHMWQEAKTFPSESRLPEVARVYGVDFEELKAVYDLSKKARKLEKSSRRASTGRVLHVNLATNYDEPPAGPRYGRCHEGRRSGGR